MRGEKLVLWLFAMLLLTPPPPPLVETEEVLKPEGLTIGIFVTPS
jgi:hypothetical protein